MKLSIGTVQFGMKYGINNNTGIPTDQELKMIFNEMKISNIDTLDTSYAYGDSELRIGEMSDSNLNVVTKFPYTNTESELVNYFNTSLKRLSTRKIYGYLAHDPINLIQKPFLWEILIDLKKKGCIDKIGYSLYYPEELEKLFELNLIPDIIQVPFNILDRKFSKYFHILKKNNIEIHSRSVFLQGVFFKDLKCFPEKLKSLIPNIKLIKKIAHENNITIEDLALNYVYNNNLIDKIIVGVENIHQLQSNIDIINKWHYNHNLMEQIENLQFDDNVFFNPAKWNL